MSPNDKKSEAEIPQGLRALKSLKVDPSPFLASRIEANWRATANENLVKPQRSFAWLFASSVITAALIALIFVKPTNDAQVFALSQPYMIRVDVSAISRDEVAYAEIDLEGESAQFTSKKYVDIAQQKKLVVAADRIFEKKYLPIIVEGVKSGEAKVKVSFYNANHDIIATKVMNLKFRGATI